MTPHLCEKHQEEFDATDEEVIQARIRTHQARPPHQKSICGTCRATLLYPFFRLCKLHARQDRLCQQCCASTLSGEELATAAERAEEQARIDVILDDYTIIVKTYGCHTWIAKEFRDAHPDLDLGTIHPTALDARQDRPVWKEVLGPNIYRKVFCDRCAEERFLHGFREAAECGHIAIGRAFVLCHLCAVRSKQCAACGNTPT